MFYDFITEYTDIFVEKMGEALAYTVDSRYLDFGYLEQSLISKRKSGPYLKVRSGNKILSIRGEIAPREQFLLFSTIFSIYISK